MTSITGAALPTVYSPPATLRAEATAAPAKGTTQADASTSSVAVAPTPTAFSQNKDQFDTLSSTVLDTSGKFSDDQRLQAYSSLFEMGVKDKLRGMDTDNAKQYWQAIMYSDIGTRAAQLQQQGVSTMISAAGRGESPAAAQLKFVAGLSAADQKIDFTVTANSFTSGGSRRYADFDSYRNQLVTKASRYVPEGAAQALKALSSAAAGDTWGTQVLGLFKSVNSSDSSSATSSSAIHTSNKSKLPGSYQPGGIYTQVA